MSPDHAELLVGELDGDLLNVAARADDGLHDLDGPGRGRGHARRHLRRLQLDHLEINIRFVERSTKPGISC